MDNTAWDLVSLRRMADGLLSGPEKESLTILHWEENWEKYPQWKFGEGTVARYQGGILLVRPQQDGVVDPFILLKHELGHHLTLHSSGRFRAAYLQLAEPYEKSSLTLRRGLLEGAADSIGLFWGGKANARYLKMGAEEEDFAIGYWQGRSLLTTA